MIQQMPMAKPQEKAVSNEETTTTSTTTTTMTTTTTIKTATAAININGTSNNLKTQLSMLEKLLFSHKMNMPDDDHDYDDNCSDNASIPLDDGATASSTSKPLCRSPNNDTTNDNRAMSNRQSSDRRSWANTDWDVIEQKCVRRLSSSSSANSLYSLLDASQSSFYQILDYEIEDLENNESSDNDIRNRGGPSRDDARNRNDDNDDEQTNEVSSKGETRDKSLATTLASFRDHRQQQQQQPKLVKRKSMLELLNEDEDLFSASLASLNLSVARTSTSSTCLFGESDHDFSSYVDDCNHDDDDGEVWRRE